MVQVSELLQFTFKGTRGLSTVAYLNQPSNLFGNLQKSIRAIYNLPVIVVSVFIKLKLARVVAYSPANK